MTPFLPIACLFFFVFSVACSPKVITSSPPPPPPAKAFPAPGPKPRLGSIPATQRPYQIDGRTYYPLPSAEGYSETGQASWYGDPFHGRKTSNGETYNMYDWTAAHKTLPMHTRLLVENLENGKSTTVRINDRGPFAKERIIDLSYNVARELEVVRKGSALVRITALGEAKTVQTAGVSAPQFLPHPDFKKGDFYVQIGAFINPDNAERLKDRLIREGRPAGSFRYDRGDQIFYRVQIKAGQNLDAAEQLARELAVGEFANAYVVAH